MQVMEEAFREGKRWAPPEDMPEGTIIVCEECEGKFSLEAQTFVERQGKLEFSGFNCPHCKRRYVAVVTDPDTRQLQQTAMAQRRAMLAAATRKERRFYERELRKTQRKIGKAIERLKFAHGAAGKTTATV